MKNVTMNSTTDLPINEEEGASPDLFGMDVNTYNSVMHISQLAGIILPGLGLFAPIGLWLYGKDKSEEVKRHGLHILNWTITLYLLVFLVIGLCFMIIGLFILPVLILVATVFPIIGMVKASNGKEWTYPMSHDFFKV